MQELGQVLSLVDRETAGDLGPLAAVDAVRVLDEVDDRPRDDLAVEDDREVTGKGRSLVGRGDPSDRAGLPFLGDPAGDLLEGVLAVAGEVEGHIRLVELVEVLLRILDLGSGKGRVVLEDEVAGLRLVVDRLAVGIGRQLVDDDRALGNLLDDALVRDRPALIVVVEVFLRRDRPRDQFMGLLVEEVVLVTGGAVLALVVAWLLGGEVDRVPHRRFGTEADPGAVETFGRRAAGVDPGLADLLRDFRGVGSRPDQAEVTGRSDQVVLPVIEVKPGGFGCAFGRGTDVGRARNAHRDLVGAQSRNLDFGNAELVATGTDDVHRAVHRLGSDFLDLRGRPPCKVSSMPP